MGLRETLNENPRITTGITVAIIVLVLAWILWPRDGAAGGGDQPVGAGSGERNRPGSEIARRQGVGEHHEREGAGGDEAEVRGGRGVARGQTVRAGRRRRNE